MATTPTLALRYPVSTDRVADGALAIQHLAEDVEAQLAPLVTPDHCRVYRSAALNIATGTAGSVMSWDAEDDDTSGTGMHDPANPGRITALRSGLYLVIGQVSYVGNATGQRAAYLAKSGTDVARVIVAAHAANLYLQVATLVNLTAGQYVELSTWQNSGGALALNTGNVATWLDMTRVGG